MDDKDREIIQMLQSGFPLETQPYQVIGDRLWLDEVSVISRISRMIQKGIIRHIGPFFDSSKLGYSGVLAAIQVPEDEIDAVAKILEPFSEITHNYLREGEPNMWFTVIARSKERQEEILDIIRTKSGIKEINLFSSKRLFKVKVDLD